MAAVVPRSLADQLQDVNPRSVDDVLRELVFTGPDTLENIEREIWAIERQNKARRERLDSIEGDLLIAITAERTPDNKVKFPNEAARSAQLAKSAAVHREHQDTKKAVWDSEERIGELKRAHARITSEIASARVWLLYKSRAGALA